MSDDWDKPITKPLPGPVASEAMQMSTDERERLTLIAEHAIGLHREMYGRQRVPYCPLCVAKR